MLKKSGPLLLASNHPNSFLDAVILDILFHQPVWSLTRGDVFRNPIISRLLSALNMFPVYRVTEGVENLNINYATFEKCKELFRKQGIVLIFSEGKCVNEWRLRPLKKGTARLAINSWEENIPLKILPVGINYSSFRRFGKNVMINFGAIISREDIPLNLPEGMRYQAFNNTLHQQLNSLVYQIDKENKQKQQAMLEKQPSRFERMLFAVPAAIGWILHFPLYIPLQTIIYKKTMNNDHYDSIMAAVLLFTYPFYLLTISFLGSYFIGSYVGFFASLLLPVTAWCYVQVKPQLDK